MLLFRYYLFFGSLLLTRLGFAQTAFQAKWSFDTYNLSGSSTNPIITASDMQISGVDVSSVSSIAYPSGQVGRNVNIQRWSVGGCNAGEYVDFTVTPTGSARITLTSLTFFFAHSSTGPQQISVRSSADGFTADLLNQIITTTFQTASISLASAGFINQSTPITFRIYACNAISSNGALKLDEVTINGSVLPVELLYFNAQLVNDHVELAWATVWERNADRFIIERSRDLREFGSLGSVSAKGTTDQIHYYAYTDHYPGGGTTYYRLKQIDIDGTISYSKPVAVILDDQTPVMTLLGNPVEGSVIRVATRNLTGATFTLLTITGQYIPLRAEVTASDILEFRAFQTLSPGLYWLLAAKEKTYLLIKIVMP